MATRKLQVGEMGYENAHCRTRQDGTVLHELGLIIARATEHCNSGHIVVSLVLVCLELGVVGCAEDRIQFATCRLL